MRHLLLVPVILSTLMLGAHLLRGGHLLFAIAAAALPLLLLSRQRSVLLLLQGLLVVGALEWLRTLASILEQRRAFAEPWYRLAAILGAVALVTAFSALAAGAWQRTRQARQKTLVPAEAA